MKCFFPTEALVILNEPLEGRKKKTSRSKEDRFHKLANS